MIAARWVDVGLTAPHVFHRTYAALAESCGTDGAPAVLWGRAESHVCIGQSQDPETELAPEIPVPVVRRPLGGGAVWIDPSQHLFALIVPLRLAPGRPEEWFEWGLQPVLGTFRDFALAVERRQRDLWLEGRKIAGSGAATIGRCAVLGSSFLMAFPAEHFAACIACPSAGFRAWLEQALREAVTDWASHGEPPPEQRLAAVFRARCEEALGWSLRDSGLTPAEIATRERAPDGDDDWFARGRLTPDGIRLNAATFLTERRENGRWARVLTRGRKVARVALSAPVSGTALQAIANSRPTSDAITAVLAGEIGIPEAGRYADLILGTARFS
ncbi:MAG: lipoate--protein ligase family protein [Betaproteobacteria bacterium]|nr:lipoate--protein ligase family protein [Betaproteobacteria bacterium]